MATSSSVDYNDTRSEIIGDSLILVGAIEQGEAASAEDGAYADRQLNRMVKAWQTKGIHLWTRREATLFVTPSQAGYTLGPNSSDHAAEDTEIARTTLSADEASGQTVLSVTSSTDMTAADQVGVVLDDDTLHWTTIVSVDSSIQITITTATTGAAASGNYLYTYTNKLGRPLRVEDARRRNEADDQDTPIIVISHEEYQRLPNKTDDGETNEVYYQPLLNDGQLSVWPRPNSVARTIRLSCLLAIEDFDTAANNPDFPQEWLDPLVWNLAKRLLPSYGASGLHSAQDIKVGAREMLDDALMFDQEPESIFFQPNLTHAHGG